MKSIALLILCSVTFCGALAACGAADEGAHFDDRALPGGPGAVSTGAAPEDTTPAEDAGLATFEEG
jgi:hypothetical protein